jgi:tRNA (cmo5U34)-methyltransferase
VEIDLVCADIQDVAIENASLVVMNFTLQFIPPQDRRALLEKIYAGLRPGGLLILSEKVHLESKAMQTLIEDLHLQFKRANGYSELEISQKRASLDRVLVSDTLATHFARFQDVGFKDCAVWHQTYNFLSMVAMK